MGGGGNPATLTVNSLVSEVNFVKEAKSDKKNSGEGGCCRALKRKQYARLCQRR